MLQFASKTMKVNLIFQQRHSVLTATQLDALVNSFNIIDTRPSTCTEFSVCSVLLFVFLFGLRLCSEDYARKTKQYSSNDQIQNATCTCNWDSHYFIQRGSSPFICECICHSGYHGTPATSSNILKFINLHYIGLLSSSTL